MTTHPPLVVSRTAFSSPQSLTPHSSGNRLAAFSALVAEAVQNAFVTALFEPASAHASPPGSPTVASSFRPNGPFSSLFDPPSFETRVRAATSLDTLADLGFLALNPQPRHHRGHDTETCQAAWGLWKHLEWTLAAATDGLMFTVYDNPDRDRDVFVEPQLFSSLQLQLSKELVLALALPSDQAQLSRVLRAFAHSTQEHLEQWVRQTDPSLLLSSTTGPAPLTLDARRAQPDPDAKPALLGHARSEIMKLFFGEHFLRELTETQALLDEAQGIDRELSQSSPSSEEQQDTHPKRGRTFLRWCAQEREQLRDELPWDGEAQPSKASRDSWSGATHVLQQEGQARVVTDALLGPTQQTMGNLAHLLASTFGLRKVAVSAFGGTQRTCRELRRALLTFSQLATRTRLPAHSLGLGGLSVVLAKGRGTVAQASALACFSPNSDNGPQSAGLPGTLRFSAPFRFLEHEWTHAWDFLLCNATHSGPAQAPTPLALARTQLMDAAQFEAPVSATTRRQFNRVLERVFLRRLWSETAPVDGDWRALLLERGTSSARESLQAGHWPKGFKRDLRAVWLAILEGSEKTIRHALQTVVRHVEVPGQHSGLSPQAWITATAADLHQDRKVLRGFRTQSAQRKEWGPMRWAAQALVLAEKTNYFIEPCELLARACESVLGTSTAESQPQDWLAHLLAEQTDQGHWVPPAFRADHDLSIAAVETQQAENTEPLPGTLRSRIYALLLPFGEEKARFAQALTQFFEHAHPTFSRLGEQRLSLPVHALVNPNGNDPMGAFVNVNAQDWVSTTPWQPTPPVPLGTVRRPRPLA